MTEQRKKFEAWAHANGYDIRPSRIGLPFADGFTNSAWEIWQAAIAAAEAAHPVCENDEVIGFLRDLSNSHHDHRKEDNSVLGCIGHKASWLLSTMPEPPAIADPVALPEWLLSADDMKNLRRFAECCEDFESGGHDVPKAEMKRLELAGAVRSCGFGRHETTAFGDAMLSAPKDKDEV